MANVMANITGASAKTNEKFKCKRERKEQRQEKAREGQGGPGRAIGDSGNVRLMMQHNFLVNFLGIKSNRKLKLKMTDNALTPADRLSNDFAYLA